MQGLINRSIQCFIGDTYGESVWLRVVEHAGLDFASFEAFLEYSIETTFALIDSIEEELSQPRANFLEDLGTYLITSETTSPVRRLLRFGGRSFEDFVLSLDELPERVNLALPDVSLPEITVSIEAPNHYTVRISSGIDGFSFVVVGVLRALADDYGALAFIEHNVEHRIATISVLLADNNFAAGKSFDFARSVYAAG